MTFINGGHHITLCVNGAQEDVDFHMGALGLRLIKRTVLFDGVVPVYHLYYSNANGDPSSIITTFPFKQAGVIGRRGTNQAREVQLAVPVGSLDYWHRRLESYGITALDVEILDSRRLLFDHPSGVEYVMVEVADDPRVGWTEGGVPLEYAIHGVYGVGIHAYAPESMVEFTEDSFLKQDKLIEDGDRVAFKVGSNDGPGSSIEIIGNRKADQGTWTYAAGTIHHYAWNLGNLDNQSKIKFDIEGAGYTDISELKDRKYFKSFYVRTPSGALFELAVTHPEGGWTCDESPEELGKAFQLPSQFEIRRQELLGRLETITTRHLEIAKA
ncbi:ring-cleaving dioxygenase [Arthrobacter sp. CAU 1506]|uniref:VOC family protein n=1 Tax=Arthrobacter sp. CAU 1506 TaxID=2560052 RepID=UPI0010ABAB84|nr:VOC family protein [Arthrobacter sp. CAU 1506]TJY64100.1 ring-cleaving dioxygenase [Arthrobacter sp. CAU 1506]